MTLDVSRIAPVNHPLMGADGSTVRSPQEGPSFADTLKGFLHDVSRLEQTADQQVEELARGGAVDPHEVMMAVEEANLALDLLLEIRNKLLEAYQQLTRTQL